MKMAVTAHFTTDSGDAYDLTFDGTSIEPIKHFLRDDEELLGWTTNISLTVTGASPKETKVYIQELWKYITSFGLGMYGDGDS